MLKNYQDEKLIISALWILSNIVCENGEIVEKVTSNDIFLEVVNLTKSHNIRIKKEALITLAHSIVCGNQLDTLKVLMNQRVSIVEILVKGLELGEYYADLTFSLLEAI
jgi:hypothetical protein